MVLMIRTNYVSGLSFFFNFFQITLIIMKKLKKLLFIALLLMAGMVQGQDVGYYATNDSQNSVFYVYKTINSGSSWSVLTDANQGSNTPYNFRAAIIGIDFVTADTGYVLLKGGDNDNPTKISVSKTMDGGQTWNRSIVLPVFQTDSIVAFDFADNSTGYIFTYFVDVNQGTRGSRIHKTTDGGQTWGTLGVGGSAVELLEQTNHVQFVSPNIGRYVTRNINIAVGPLVRKTTDGGLTWSIDFNANISNFDPILNMDMINNSIGYIVVNGLQNEAYVYKTSNAWSTSTLVTDLNGSANLRLNRPVNSFNMVSEDVGYASYTGTGLIKQTIDGAVSFNNQLIPGTTQFASIGSTELVDFVEGSNITTLPKLIAKSVSFKIYPNPTNGITTITTENYQDKNYVVMSLTGQVLLQNNLSDVQTTIDLAALQTKGAYIILIRDTNTQQVLDKNIVIYK